MAKRTVRTRKVARKGSAPKAKATKSRGSRVKTSRSSGGKAKATRRTRKTSVSSRSPKTRVTKRTTRKSGAARKVASQKSTRKPGTVRKVASQKSTRKPGTVRKVASQKSMRKPSKPSTRRSTTSSKKDFDFNAWLLPTLELEQYEPHIVEEAGVQDSIKGSTRYAWIGGGQCGGRIVKSFHDLGYRKVLAVNTTHHDLDLLEIPQNQKFLMDIGEKGAGKDMERGRHAIQQYQQEILHLARQTFGGQVDHIMVCFGAGGGTGGGSATGLIEIAKRYARYVGMSNPDKAVGAIMTLPTVGEASSPLVAQNAHDIACELSEIAAEGKISPLIIIDNEKISKLYPGMTVKSFWPSINSTVAGLFDIFNRVSALSTRYTSFDPVDYHSIMEAGGCSIMGLTRVNKFADRFAISEAVKRNLEKTLLASGFNLSTARVAGCIVVGSRKLMAEVKGLQDNINYAFDVLSEVTGKATIHRGIYEDGKNSLRVYTIIGGLDAPTQRLEELLSCVAVHAR
jgi:cell division GTPase FtsZ